MQHRDRDAQAVFAVRVLLLLAALRVVTDLAVAAAFKIVDTGRDAGQLATVVAWPAGVAMTLTILWLRRGRRVQ